VVEVGQELLRWNISATAKIKKQEEKALLIPNILSYLPVGQCASAAVVDSYWNRGANMYKDYTDFRDCYPWQVCNGFDATIN
jgi:hypothetical protein